MSIAFKIVTAVLFLVVVTITLVYGCVDGRAIEGMTPLGACSMTDYFNKESCDETSTTPDDSSDVRTPYAPYRRDNPLDEDNWVPSGSGYFHKSGIETKGDSNDSVPPPYDFGSALTEMQNLFTSKSPVVVMATYKDALFVYFLSTYMCAFTIILISEMIDRESFDSFELIILSTGGIWGLFLGGCRLADDFKAYDRECMQSCEDIGCLVADMVIFLIGFFMLIQFMTKWADITEGEGPTTV